jgi:hypothetical protein
MVCARLVQDVSPLSTLPALVRQLRRQTEAAQLSGGLLFDGERVVMLFEGAIEAVAALLEDLQRAPQIEAGSLDPLLERPVPDACAERWLAGYAEPECIGALTAADVDPEAMVASFRRALVDADAL